MTTPASDRRRPDPGFRRAQAVSRLVGGSLALGILGPLIAVALVVERRTMRRVSRRARREWTRVAAEVERWR